MTKNSNIFNCNREDAIEKFNLFRCQRKMKNKSVLPSQICKGKGVSNNTSEHMDIVAAQATGIHFQQEIITDILSKLPVQPLLRFKCVSKFWKALISDRYFKMKHLSHAKNNQNSQKFLISRRCFNTDDMFNFYCSSLSSVQLIEDVQRLDCALSCRPLGCKIYCCSDGLFFLVVNDGLDKHLLLWNPSTRESVRLPHPEFMEDCVYGLGYDATSDDYKILKIDVNTLGRKVPDEILALKNGSWEKIAKRSIGIHPVFSCADTGRDSLAFVHGAFHWLGLSLDYTVVSFNISNEVYREIPLLKRMCNIYNMWYIEYDLSVLEGMLCFYSTCNHREEGTFKLWVMKDYGVKESWIELFTLRDSGLYSAKPKYRFADGDVLLYCNHFRRRHPGPLFRTSKGLFGLWPQCYTFQEGFAYTESVISPKLIT